MKRVKPCFTALPVKCHLTMPFQFPSASLVFTFLLKWTIHANHLTAFLRMEFPMKHYLKKKLSVIITPWVPPVWPTATETCLSKNTVHPFPPTFGSLHKSDILARAAADYYNLLKLQWGELTFLRTGVFSTDCFVQADISCILRVAFFRLCKYVSAELSIARKK